MYTSAFTVKQRVLHAVLVVGYLPQLIGVYAQSVDTLGGFRGDAGSQPRGENQAINSNPVEIPYDNTQNERIKNNVNGGDGSADRGFPSFDTSANDAQVVRMREEIKDTDRSPDDVTNSSQPQSVKISFTFSNMNISLNLVRNRNISPQSPVIVYREDGSMVSVDTGDFANYAFYCDPLYQASIMIENTTDTTTQHPVRHYSGTFYINDDQYGLEPMSQSGSRRRRRSTFRNVKRSNRERRADRTDDIMQIVYKNNRTTTDPSESVREPSIQLQNDNSSVNVQDRLDPSFQGKAFYTIEILAVIDYRLFLRWYNLSSMQTSQDKQTDAINNIRFYFLHVFNGVYMRYQSINTSVYAINTSLVGMYIATSANGSRFVEDNRVNGSPLGTVNAYNAMYQFNTWINSNPTTLPTHDQATLLTSENMIGQTGDRISGLSVIRGMCSSFSVTICKDLGEYSVTETVAHEIGHNLGCGHDGIDNDCSIADQYIMVGQAAALTNANYLHPYTFSTCSISEIQNFLATLSASTRPSDHCLTTQSEPNIDIQSSLGMLPGQRYSPDLQCLLLYGHGSYYCGGETEDWNICRSMQCFQPQLRYCYVTFEQQAYDGTTCGNKSWCIQSSCEYNQAAPEAPDTCIYGDYKGPYTNGLSCALIVTSAQWNCYNDAYYDDCCLGCPSIYNASMIGCEYGDKLQSCLTMPLFDCYNSSVRDTCCVRCQLDQDQQGCEYGDKVSWCEDYIQSNIDCYNQKDACCATCQKYRTNITGCQFGDQAAWCSTVPRTNCYSSSFTCCSTCSKWYNETAVGCEYGDKSSWCVNETVTGCYTDDSTCCSTCAQLSTGLAGCKYGDHLASCSSLTQIECYDQSSACCKTCANYSTGVIGCEYGDKAPWCSSKYCSTNPVTCCQSCTASFGANNITTITASTTSPTSPHILVHPTSSALITTSTGQLTQGPTIAPHLTTNGGTTSGSTVSTTHLSTSTSIQSSSTRLTSTQLASTQLTSTQSTSTTLANVTACDLEPYWCAISTPSVCYTVDGVCCKMCPGVIYNRNVPSCYYGDHYSWCSDPRYSATYCADKAQRLNCCATCSVVPREAAALIATTTVSTFSGCTNDKASYCLTMPTLDCYGLAGICCQTCQNRYISAIGCEFGDRVSWCSQFINSIQDCRLTGIAFYCCQTCAVKYQIQCTDSAAWCNTISPSQCYSDNIQGLNCCSTCRQYRKGNPAGCPYGDLSSWCSTISINQCNQYKYVCCQKCGAY